MSRFLGGLHLLLAIVALFGVRWAYAGYVATALAAIPARSGFNLVRPVCETVVPPYYYAYSLTNYAHIILFGIFFIITLMQFRVKNLKNMGWAFLATLVVGLIIELEEGSTLSGNCRMRDLIPDSAGAVIAGLVILGIMRWRRRAPG